MKLQSTNSSIHLDGLFVELLNSTSASCLDRKKVNAVQSFFVVVVVSVVRTLSRSIKLRSFILHDYE